MSNTAPPKWLRYRSVGYLVGKGLTWGADWRPFPLAAHDAGRFALTADLVKSSDTNIIGDSEQLNILANDSFDWLWLGPRIDKLGDIREALKLLCKKLKTGGHLLVHTEMQAEDFNKHIGAIGSWKSKAAIDRDGQRLLIFKKRQGSNGIIAATPRPTKRACICRYGAIGDMIMLTPLIRQLKADGFHVTLNVTPYCAPVIENNPHVDNLIIQEREGIPNGDLGEYWAEWKSEYDRYINLSESIEGGLLKVEGRRDFYTSSEWRRAKYGHVNYYDRTMELGGYPDVTGTRGELFFSNQELQAVQRLRNQLRGKFLVLWGLSGSSHHKNYPKLEETIKPWLDMHPDAHLVTSGDTPAQILEFPHAQATPLAGKLHIRQALALPTVADVVVGPESMLINAAGCYDVPKICLLSHSSRENLVKYFTNDYSLEPDTSIAPCYPCHQLHYTKPSCPLVSISNPNDPAATVDVPKCTVGITGERLLAQLDAIYEKWKYGTI